LQSAAQDLGEDDGVVVLRVPGRINESEWAVAGMPPEFREPRPLATKFIHIASAKLLEATWLVTEPLPEFGARREFTLPLIELDGRARNAAWPETVDQDPITVRRCCRPIGAFQADVHW
jgi:hypothetical protein